MGVTLLDPKANSVEDLVKHERFHSHLTGPDSLVVRPSASGAVGRGFAPWSRHTKGVENGTSSSLADARKERKIVEGKYPLLVMSQNCS